MKEKIRIFQPKLSWLAIPFALIFVAYFVVPLILTLIVSFWDYTEYSIIPDFIIGNYIYIFDGCFTFENGLCLTFKTYISTFFFCFFTWLLTLLLGFCVAYFLAFYVNSLPMQITLFLICTIPFWTSNVIRMVSWIPLLGRNGLVNDTLITLGLIQEPIEWLLYSSFSVILALVHLYTLFMIVPIFNSMLRIDKEVIEAAYDSGAVKAGVKTIEHGSIMQLRTMKLMREKNTYLVPTISAGEHVAKMAAIPGYYPEIIIPKALEVGVQNKASTKRAYEMGVPISFGTDAGVFPHGDNAGEFIYWEEIGIPAEYSLKAATITNAKLLNMENFLGQIKKGFFADIIATNESPTKDISTLKNIVFVMKDGKVYKK